MTNVRLNGNFQKDETKLTWIASLNKYLEIVRFGPKQNKHNVVNEYIERILLFCLQREFVYVIEVGKWTETFINMSTLNDWPDYCYVKKHSLWLLFAILYSFWVWSIYSCRAFWIGKHHPPNKTWAIGNVATL